MRPAGRADPRPDDKGWAGQADVRTTVVAHSGELEHIYGHESPHARQRKCPGIAVPCRECDERGLFAWRVDAAAQASLRVQFSRRHPLGRRTYLAAGSVGTAGIPTAAHLDPVPSPNEPQPGPAWPPIAAARAAAVVAAAARRWCRRPRPGRAAGGQ